MTRDEALELNHLLMNVQGHKALNKYLENRIENIKKELLYEQDVYEIRGLQKSAFELMKLLNIRDSIQKTLEVNDG